MKILRSILALCLLLTMVEPALAQPRGLRVGAGIPAAAPVAPLVPATAAPAFGALTGAVTRTLPDPGPIRRMWFVYETEQERERSADVLARIAEENPGVEIVFHRAEDVIRYVDEDGKKKPDGGEKAQRELAERIAGEKAEFVLASNQALYESFRGLRDSELARETPFGFAGRRHVSVDIPRASLDPRRLSDPRDLPHRRFLLVTAGKGPEELAAAGMTGQRRAFQDLLAQAGEEGHGPAKKDSDMGLADRLGSKLLLHLAGQADDRETARRREEAHRLAAYVESERVDVLATDDQRAARALGLMKSMGYHKSLPVVWTGRRAPADASAVTLRARPSGLESALRRAKAVERLPDNFMEMGGVSVKDFEPRVAEAVARSVPPLPPGSGRYDVHVLLTNGNGIREKGDANPYGHFGMAVTDETGKTLVWSVQYNDGGSFTGGLGDVKQMTLAEYLYALWYLPGTVGQAIPLAETAVSTVMDVILRGALDKAGLQAMRRMAADLNARHLMGGFNYGFFADSNCANIVTQIMRAAGFAIAESGVQAPADKAAEMIVGFARRLLSGQLGAHDAGFVVFERPAHAGPEHYRIANTALGTPLFNRVKAWKAMSFLEKAWRVLTALPNLLKSRRIPKMIESFADKATGRVVVGPASRELEIVDNPRSPIMLMRVAETAVQRLRRERVPIEDELAEINAELLKAGGYQDWAPGKPWKPANPGEEARLQERRRRHHELEAALALNIFDEALAQRAVEYHRLQIADVHGRYESRLKLLDELAEKAAAYRETMRREDRALNVREIKKLNELNARGEKELQRIRLALLNDLGPRVPQDMGMISRQVTLETLDKMAGRRER
ncbi:MAG: hypothetical protein HY403_06675 [Elusimicrobia bacterium]|nr:hypothetical protein [Elusimicrobiota bacterium]